MKINYFDFTLKLRLIHIAFVTSIISIYQPLSTKIQGQSFSIEVITFLGFLTPLAGLISYYFKKINPILNYYVILGISVIYVPCSLSFYFDYIRPESYIIGVILLDFLILLFSTNFSIDLNTRIAQIYEESVYKNYLRFSMIVTNTAIILISAFMILIQSITQDYKYIIIILIWFEVVLAIFDISFRNKILKIFK